MFIDSTQSRLDHCFGQPFAKVPVPLGKVGKNYSSKEEEFLLPRTTSPKKIRRPHIRTSADVLQRNNPCEGGSNGTAVVSSANAVNSGLMIVSRTALIACLRALQHHNPTLARSRAA